MAQEHSISDTVDHLFRQESGKMIAVLTRIFGIDNYSMAEDVVQDALLKALEVWKYRGMPDNPQAWLYRTARNKAIDIIRKNKYSQTIDFTDPDRLLLTSEYSLPTTMDLFWSQDQMEDNFLAMMFACCHPDLSADAQITFILKSLCGFSTREVAKAFLTSEDTISKRLYRTKDIFRSGLIKLQIPKPEQLESRMQTVLKAIYLLFNEGYNATHNEHPIRIELVGQAMSLCRLLADSPKTQCPQVYALIALICFHTARMKSRTSQGGQLILLDQQNRADWDRHLINTGIAHLDKAASGQKMSIYHLEAGIAYEHCLASDYEATNWKRILEYYDLLLSMSSDPVVALNRCLVILKIYGPTEAMKIIASLGHHKQMKSYYLYYAVLASINEEMGNTPKAVSYYTKSLSLTQSIQERQLLKNRIAFLSIL